MQDFVYEYQVLKKFDEKKSRNVTTPSNFREKPISSFL